MAEHRFTADLEMVMERCLHALDTGSQDLELEHAELRQVCSCFFLSHMYTTDVKHITNCETAGTLFEYSWG